MIKLMPSAPQAQNRAQQKMRLKLRRRADERGLTFTALAELVRHDLAVVSKAINYGKYPRVLAKLKETLDV